MLNKHQSRSRNALIKTEIDAHSALQAQSKEHNTYIMKSWRQSNVLICLITTVALWPHGGYGKPVAKRQHAWRTTAKELRQMEKDKVLQWCKNHGKTSWNKSLIDKNKAYGKNIQLLRMIKERLATCISQGP